MDTINLIKQAHMGDKNSRDQILIENTPLIWSIVKRFLGRGYEGEDLFQIGCIGMLKAIDRFDLSLNLSFSTYAVPLITGEIRRFLRDDGIIKISRTIKENQNKIMLEKGYGKIINIASMVSWFGGQTVPAYTAAKGGVTQLTKELSNDWIARGINVNAIAPGYMATEMNAALLDKENPRYQQITDRIPANRWGTGDDMKGACIFLASHASDYLGGAIIPVDGGYLVK